MSLKRGNSCQFPVSKSYNKIWHFFSIFCNFCVSENFNMSPVRGLKGKHTWSIRSIMTCRGWTPLSLHSNMSCLDQTDKFIWIWTIVSRKIYSHWRHVKIFWDTKFREYVETMSYFVINFWGKKLTKNLPF